MSQHAVAPKRLPPSAQHAAREMKRLVLRLRVFFGYVPNLEWFRVQLSRSVVLDRAPAHAAIAEIEPCLTLRKQGGSCRRLHVLR
jgi:hypothetical protein